MKANLIYTIVFCIFVQSQTVKNHKKNTIITGKAKVVDGDTIIVNDTKIRLFGIDAPELKQICSDVKVGVQAKEYLEKIVDNLEIECKGKNYDRYRRLVATCETDGIDLGSVLVKSGYAFNYDTYTTQYKAEEKSAKRNGLPVWKHKCEEPYSFRRKKADL